MTTVIPPAVVNLGNEQMATFRLNGQEFQCFALDELDLIHTEIAASTPPANRGEPFLKIVQKRLLDRFGITASLSKASAWYDALHAENERQTAFFDELPASSGSTDSLRTGDASTNSSRGSDATSPPSKTASKPKNSRKNSATTGKNSKRDGTT